jgi:serine/threonine protein kinase
VQHLKKEPKPLAEIRPDLPPTLCHIVHKMLAKDPRQRYQSGGEILGELRRLHAELGDDPWPSDLHDWEGSELDASSNPRGDATRRLQKLMNNPTTKPNRHFSRGLLVLGIAAAFLLGGVMAWVTAEPNPLADTEAADYDIPRQQTALGQWYQAGRIDTEAGWQSVIDYFPENEHFTRSAEKKLAEIYLRRGDYPQAMTIFERFAASGNKDVSFRAYGMAGKSFVLAAQGNLDESAVILKKLRPILDSLGNPQMRRLVEYAEKKTGLLRKPPR